MSRQNFGLTAVRIKFGESNSIELTCAVCFSREGIFSKGSVCVCFFLNTLKKLGWWCGGGGWW